MKRLPFILWLSVLVSGACASSQSARSNDAPQPQLLRFFGINQVKLKPTGLTVFGSGSASTNGGKTAFIKKGFLSSDLNMELTVQGDSTTLESCRQQVQTAWDRHMSVDIRGMGSFTVKSTIDPPLDTGIFVLTQLDACGAYYASAGSPSAAPAVVPPEISITDSSTTPASELVAVPERYADRSLEINGQMDGPVHFMEPVSRMTITSEGQSIPAYFVTQSLPEESRLALVHGGSGHKVLLRGTLVRITPKSLAAQSGETVTTGYEFDISKVVSVWKP